MDWTIDTNILGLASKNNWNAIELLNQIKRQRDYINLDINGEIEQEYKRCLKLARQNGKKGHDETKKWFIFFVSNGLIHFIDGKISMKQKSRLLAKNFHDDDIPFVQTCKFSFSKKLITEDSDYTDEIKKILHEEHEICVSCICECLPQS